MPLPAKKLSAFVASQKGSAFKIGKKAPRGKDIDVDAIAKDIKDGKGDPKLMDLAKGVTEETNPPSWIADEDIWEKAKAAVKPKWDDYDEPYAVVSAVYRRMGGAIKHG